MINWESNNIESNEWFCLPKWFMEWFIIISRIESDVSKRVTYYLERWLIWTSIEIFEEQTRENENKVWH